MYYKTIKEVEKNQKETASPCPEYRSLIKSNPWRLPTHILYA